MVVGVFLREPVLVEQLEPRAVGLVVAGLPLLVLHDLALVVEVVLVERVEQAAHPVGLEPQRGLEVVGRDGLEVVGAVDPRRPVEGAAGGGDQAEVVVAADVARALEHQVLEEVGEPGLARCLMPRSDVVPEVDGDDRREMVLADHDAQAVVELVTRERIARQRGHPARIGGARCVLRLR